MNKTNQIHFYLGDQEYDRLIRRVSKSGLSLSVYMRHLINDRVPKDKPPQEYFDILKELRSIGKDINQIAAAADSAGIIDAKQYHDNYLELLHLTLNLIDATEMPKEVR